MRAQCEGRVGLATDDDVDVEAWTGEYARLCTNDVLALVL